MTSIPTHLQDAKTLLSENGFATGDTWYHGTSSGLIDSIRGKGLVPSGDAESIKKAKGAMIAIGDSYKENKDPIFLTQCKELAFYWATKRAQSRGQLFSTTEEPTVLAITLPDNLNKNVKTDVGAAAMLMGESEEYLETLNGLYTANNLKAPEVDPLTADRMDFLNLLGMAYSKQAIAPGFIEVLEA